MAKFRIRCHQAKARWQRGVWAQTTRCSSATSMVSEDSGRLLCWAARQSCNKKFLVQEVVRLTVSETFLWRDPGHGLQDNDNNDNDNNDNDNNDNDKDDNDHYDNDNYNHHYSYNCNYNCIYNNLYGFFFFCWNCCCYDW